MDFVRKIGVPFRYVWGWKSSLGQHPEADWKILLFILVIATICFLGLAIKLYIEVMREPVLQRSEDTVVLRLVNPKEIDAVLGRFASKQIKYEEFRRKGVTVIDPSL